MTRGRPIEFVSWPKLPRDEKLSVKLSETDIEIMNYLYKNEDVSFSELGWLFGVSHVTAHYWVDESFRKKQINYNKKQTSVKRKLKKDDPQIGVNYRRRLRSNPKNKKQIQEYNRYHGYIYNVLNPTSRIRHREKSRLIYKMSLNNKILKGSVDI